MKHIEFKNLPQKLTQEGITIELLDQVQQTGKFSPAIFQQGDEPVTLTKCNAESFWATDERGVYHVDAKQKLVKYDLKTCIIARARYYAIFSEQEDGIAAEQKAKIKNREVQTEVEAMKRALIEKIEELNGIFGPLKMWAENSHRSMAVTIWKNHDPEGAAKKTAEAREYINKHPGLEASVKSINERLQAEDFDSLYIELEQNESPLLFSAKLDSPLDMKTIKNLFYPNMSPQEVSSFENASHMEKVARFKVERRYIQEDKA